MIGGPRIVLYPIGITAVVAGVAQLAAMGSADSPEGMRPARPPSSSDDPHNGGAFPNHRVVFTRPAHDCRATIEYLPA